MLWSTDIAGDARGVAVQEIPTRFEIEPAPTASPRSPRSPGAHFVWVGGQIVGAGRGWTPKLHKLDAETGEILFTLDPPPAPVYGLALDGRGNLWISAASRATARSARTAASTRRAASTTAATSRPSA